jgi:hypothetical protein
LIVACLLVVQAFVASVAVTQAAALQAQSFDSLFVICSSDGGSGGAPAVPASHHDHQTECCLVCTAAAASIVTVPEAVEILLRLEAPAALIDFRAAASSSPIPVKPAGTGLSRAPPRTA